MYKIVLLATAVTVSSPAVAVEVSPSVTAQEGQSAAPADPQQRAQCRALSDQIKHDGMCFTPTVWAIAPNGTLIARDDTCAGSRPASEFLHQLADRELATL